MYPKTARPAHLLFQSFSGEPNCMDHGIKIIVIFSLGYVPGVEVVEVDDGSVKRILRAEVDCPGTVSSMNLPS